MLLPSVGRDRPPSIYVRSTRPRRMGAVLEDVHSMPLGVDFRGYRTDSVARCHGLIAAIGEGWQTSSDSKTDAKSARHVRAS